MDKGSGYLNDTMTVLPSVIESPIKEFYMVCGLTLISDPIS